MDKIQKTNHFGKLRNEKEENKSSEKNGTFGCSEVGRQLQPQWGIWEANVIMPLSAAFSCLFQTLETSAPWRNETADVISKIRTSPICSLTKIVFNLYLYLY